MKQFTDVIGNEGVITHFRQALQADAAVHAYLIGGEKGLGKKLTAGIFAASLLCREVDPVGRPCGHCDACIKIAAGSHPDLKWITTDKNSLGVEEIRTQVVDDMSIKPYYGGRKIYLIPDAEKMTPQAQNALLKTIEEPAGYGVVILLANVEEGILPTITSRCLRLNCKPVTGDQLEKYLIRKYRLPDYRAAALAAFARGNIGRAKQLLADEEFEEMKQSLLQLLKYLSEWSSTRLLEYAAELKPYKQRIGEYLDLLQVWYRDVLLYKSTGRTEGLIFSDQTALIKRRADAIGYDGLERSLQAIGQADIRLRANVNQELTMGLLITALADNA